VGNHNSVLQKLNPSLCRPLSLRVLTGLCFRKLSISVDAASGVESGNAVRSPFPSSTLGVILLAGSAGSAASYFQTGRFRSYAR
jgi:hypothetical protein